MKEVSNFDGLMKLVRGNMGFELAQRLLEMSQEDRNKFGQHWIETERDHGGISSEDLEIVGKQLTSPMGVSAEELCKWVEADNLFAEWNVLMMQIEGSETTLKQDGIWGFTFQVPTLGEFVFPYNSVAMTTCNRLIQYESERCQ